MDYKEYYAIEDMGKRYDYVCKKITDLLDKINDINFNLISRDDNNEIYLAIKDNVILRELVLDYIWFKARKDEWFKD